MPYEPTPELIELLTRAEGGELGPEESRRLAEILKGDPAAIRFHVDYCQTHAMLAWEHGVLGGLDDRTMAAAPGESAGRRRSLLRSNWAWSLAASLLLAAAVVWIANRPARPIAWESRDAVGTVAESAGGQLIVIDLDRALSVEDTLRTGRFLLREGVVELRFGDHATLVAEAPARFAIVSSERIDLEEGKVTARIQGADAGLHINTPDAEVVDFGTEFAVDVTTDLKTEVHVFDGRVDVRPLHVRDADPVHLTANQATCVDRACGVPRGIDPDPGRFMRSLREPAARYARMVREMGPVVYLRMAPTEDGRTLRDEGSAAGHARIIRDARGAPPFASGRIGQSLHLGGPSTKEYAVVADYPKAEDDALTVMAWVFADSRPRWASIAKNWAKDAGVNLGGQFHFGLHFDDGDLEAHVHDAHGEEVAVREWTPLPLGEWHHVAFVVDGSTLRLYRDGKEVDAVECEGLSTFAPPALGVGAKLDKTGRAPDRKNTGFWDGRIDELAVFNRALTTNEIRAIHDAAFEEDDPPTADDGDSSTN